MTSPVTFPGSAPHPGKSTGFDGPRVARSTESSPIRGRRGRIGTVLLATDLTGASEEATLQAIDLAASVEARLLIVNVIDPAARKPGVVADRVDQMRAEREPRLLAVVEQARSWGVESTYLLWTGEAGKGIVAAAEAERADLI